MKKWKCLICGEIVESETRPEQCPCAKLPARNSLKSPIPS